jgi:hypothetical protein
VSNTVTRERALAAEQAIRAYCVLAVREWGAHATLSGLGAVLAQCLVAAYGEAEAAAIFRGFADDVHAIAELSRLATQLPEGRA